MIYHQVRLETTFSHRTTADKKFPMPNEITPVVIRDVQADLLNTRESV